VVGAGSEYAFDKNWTVKGEYLHYSLGTVNLSNADTGGNGGLSYSNGVNLFKVGVNYKF
jgi:outer membrane immunogenic protein